MFQIIIYLKRTTIAFSILLLGTVALPQKSKVITPENFKNPPQIFRPVSGSDGSLPAGNLIRELNTTLNTHGFGGYMFAPGRSGYLGKAYFDTLKVFLDYIRNTGHTAVFYDEVGFPSGSANKTVPSKYYRKQLIKIEEEVSGPAVFKKEMPADGWLMAVVAMNSQNSERINLTPFVKDYQLIWDAPSGQWKIMMFICVTTRASGGGIMAINYNSMADPLDPEAVQWFINTVYEPHAREVGKYFGNTIRMSFFDDVGIFSNDRTWAADFNKKFMERTGKDPAIYYPALWYDIGPETEAARYAFFDTRAEMLADGFPKILTEWGKEHNLPVAGHPPGNYEMQPVDMNADPFKFYRAQPIPLADVIFDYPHGRPGFKVISDGGDYYDKPVIAAETFNTFVPGGLKDGYRRAMELYIRGINLFVGANMGMGRWPFSKKRIIDTAIIGGPSGYAEWAGRCSMLLQGGRRVSGIAILYPIASLEAFYYFGHPDLKERIFPSPVPYAGNFVPPETDYQFVGEMLLNQVHRDFTFIHPDILLSDKITIKGNSLNLENEINRQSYKVLIMPGERVISLKTLLKIQDYYTAGGTVIATTLLPSKAAELPADDKEALENDNKIQTIILDMFGIDPTKPMPEEISEIKESAGGGRAVFIGRPDAVKLSAVLDRLEISPDVAFEGNPQPGSANGAFSFVHKVKEGKSIYFFANSSDDEVNTYVSARGRFKPELWDPYTGETTKLKDVRYIRKHGEIYTRFPLNLDPVKSVFIISRNQ